MGDFRTSDSSHRCKYAVHSLSQGNLIFTRMSPRTKITRKWKLPLQVAPVPKHQWPSRSILPSLKPPNTKHSQCNHPVLFSQILFVFFFHTIPLPAIQLHSPRTVLSLLGATPKLGTAFARPWD